MRRADFRLRAQNLAVFALGKFRQTLMTAAAQRRNFRGRGDAVRLRMPLRSSMPDAFAVTRLALHAGLGMRVGQKIFHRVAMADRAQFMLLRRRRCDRGQQ